MTDFLSLIEEAQEPTLLIGTDYRVLAVNQAFRDMNPNSLEIGTSRCFEVSHGYSSPCDQHGEACPLKKCIENNLAQRVLHIHQTKTGPEYCDIQMRPVYDKNGSLIGYSETIQPLQHASQQGRGNQLCGRSLEFQQMLSLISRVAPTDVSVLLEGESGTGKELAANAIHQSSLRKDQAFVVVECTGLTESLFESELFGYVKGAFTGAVRDKPGLIETARGGTLFLDEVGDIPMNLQVKLLRLLETGTYRPVGSVETRKADFRLISATHKALPQLIERGEFRQDLYFRLAAFPIPLPPLRERLDDLPLLVEVLLKQIGGGKTLSAAALNRLSQYAFPGNVRELRNLLQRAVLMADDKVICPEHLPAPVSAGVAESTAPEHEEPVALKDLEAHYLRRLLPQFTGSNRQLAERLGISERTLYRKLKEAGLR